MPISFKLYAVLVADSILIYDHMATITDEITFIWCRPKAPSATLFLVNRYVALFGNVYMLFVYVLPASDEVLWFRYARTQLAGLHLIYAEVSTLVLQYVLLSQPNPSCQSYLIYREVLLFLQQIFVCLILTLRTYALYCRNKRILAWMVIIGSVLGGVTAGTLGFRSSTLVPGFNCFESYSQKIAVSPGLGWTTLLLYELLIFVLTVHRIYKTRGLSLATSRRNIIGVVFQDGAMYFAVMILTNVPNIVTSYCGPNTIRGSLATITSCMSVTLISRLMLNLHKSVDAGIFTNPLRDDGHDYGSDVFSTEIDV
ncbi:hypothetical protein BD769DRAFT_227734 [Suillus cothurnatus]|nr:hypothetical protein BD769DRAFT_227734 [Suillus cothurnatus]